MSKTKSRTNNRVVTIVRDGECESKVTVTKFSKDSQHVVTVDRHYVDKRFDLGCGDANLLIVGTYILYSCGEFVECWELYRTFEGVILFRDSETDKFVLAPHDVADVF
jgi:hypothetical protein